MKGTRRVITDCIRYHDENPTRKNIWMPMYYNMATDTVNTDSGEGFVLVTYWINIPTAADINDAVHRWKWS